VHAIYGILHGIPKAEWTEIGHWADQLLAF
jgi:hypothetical protein